MESLDNYYLGKEEPHKSCLLALRGIILDHNEAITETQKWGMPCFCVHKKPMCYLWTDKKTGEPYILLVEGKQLDHPLLEAGTRAKMKILRVDPNDDLPLELIHEILGMAFKIAKGK